MSECECAVTAGFEATLVGLACVEVLKVKGLLHL